MSQAFVKEEDGQWLHDVPPTMNALINYLTRENNGVRVYEQKNIFPSKRKDRSSPDEQWPVVCKRRPGHVVCCVVELIHT